MVKGRIVNIRHLSFVVLVASIPFSDMSFASASSIDAETLADEELYDEKNYFKRFLIAAYLLTTRDTVPGVQKSGPERKKIIRSFSLLSLHRGNIRSYDLAENMFSTGDEIGDAVLECLRERSHNCSRITTKAGLTYSLRELRSIFVEGE